jgi:hypothetical protein
MILTLLLLLAGTSDQELIDALHQATSEIAMFRWMYVAIWIPMFGALITISVLNYLQYKKMLQESTEEEARSVVLRKDVYELMVERGGDIETYVNTVVEKSLKK